MFKKKDIQLNTKGSKKIYKLINYTEKKSALDYNFWEIRILHQINNKTNRLNFEKDFINSFILSKNNKKKNRSLKIYYLRNIPRFSGEVKNIIMPNQ